MHKKSVNTLITGSGKALILFRIKFQIFLLAVREFRSLKITAGLLRNFYAMKNQFAGNRSFSKLIRSGERFYWQMHIPGYPSRAFNHHILGAFDRFVPVRSFHNRLTILFMGITGKCPLNCRHCYAWNEMDGRSGLPVNELKKIITLFQERGLSQVHFGGGEPMTRFEDLLELVKSTRPCTETWIATSGYGMNREKALMLKKAGLTGAAISLDHFDPARNNEFRGNEHAFEWAETATINCTESGLLTCWSVCVTRDFLNAENLNTYIELASSYRVNFVQLLEPMVSGRFGGMDVRIDDSGIRLLEEFYLKMNTNKKYSHLPIVVYPSYHQRRMGCQALRGRYLYVDTFGCLHPCPFCHSSRELRIFSQDIDTLIEQTRKEACLFEKV